MHPSDTPRFFRLLGPLGLIVLTLLGLGFFATYGVEAPARSLGLMTVTLLLCGQGALVLAYVLGAFGLGRPLAALVAKDSVNRSFLQLGLGLGLMLSLSHLLGVWGLLSGSELLPRVVAWGLPGIGLALLVDQLVRGSLRPESWPVVPWTAALWAPGLAVLLVAACSPPGPLWASEYGAFDALSYHLQLPKEWLAGDGIRPSTHNVYSYLPSFMEAAFMHLGQMSIGQGPIVHRILGGEGSWLIGCQLLHAATGVIAALLTARAAWVMLVQIGVASRTSAAISAGLGAIVVATPWMLVVSSLAYNEAAMLALGAGAVLAAVDTGISAARRGVITGALIGAACGCKPTAILLLGPLAGLMLLGHLETRAWWKAVLGGSIAGVAVMLPWLIRNAIASGNPVFPFASGVLGRGHWTAEQIERYSRNHGADGSLSMGEKLARVFSSDFGLGHSQWAFVPYLAVLGVVAVALAPKARRAAALLVIALLAQWAAWSLLTHGQSRFLLAMLLPITLLAGLGLGGIVLPRRAADAMSSGRQRGMGVALAAGLAACLGVLAGRHFVMQNGGSPNALLAESVGALTGMPADDWLGSAPEDARREFVESINPDAFVNLVLRPQDQPGQGVYLLGDSTPLYILGADGAVHGEADGSSRVVYHVTWDASPLGAAMREHPEDPRAWSGAIAGLGCTHVLVNFDELVRLIKRSGYYDPDVTLERVAAWLTSPSSKLKLERSWPSGGAGTGRALYRIQ